MQAIQKFSIQYSGEISLKQNHRNGNSPSHQEVTVMLQLAY